MITAELNPYFASTRIAQNKWEDGHCKVCNYLA